MGARGLSEPVVDAGPLIHLAEIDALESLSIFPRIHVPGAVWDEAVRLHGVSANEIEQVCPVTHHEVESESARYAEASDLTHLHRGELECLHVCHQLGLGLLLTDDLAVRRQAKQMGITPVGSLGVVARSFRLGQVSYAEARERLEALYSTSSLFVTRTLVDIAIERMQRRSSP